MKIVVDGFGGDYSPTEVVKGAIMALEEDPALEIVLTGKKTALLNLAGGDFFGRLSVVEANSVITCDDAPVAAIRTKKDSSLVVALDAVAVGDGDALVSAGSTGAVLAGATLKIGRIKGVERPALAPELPTVDGNKVLLCDCGANSDCRPSFLVSFALMSTAYMKGVHGVKNPRVALLNNGAEESKGNEFSKEAFALLKAEDKINFIGNIEARDILSGVCDIVVCDGFTGNVALKSAEGTAGAIFSLLKKGIMNGGIKSKLGAVMLKPVFKSLKTALDYNENGGAAFLGVKKPVVKAHGASKAKSICGAILQARDIAQAGVCDMLANDLAEIAQRKATVGEAENG